jgi:hypothetical protein
MREKMNKIKNENEADLLKLLKIKNDLIRRAAYSIDSKLIFDEMFDNYDKDTLSEAYGRIQKMCKEIVEKINIT